jgi:type I restriction enzyme S subunit
LVLDADAVTFHLEFLAAILRRRNLNEIAAKTAQPLITGTQVSDQKVPTPPLEDQRQIIEYLTDELGTFKNLTLDVQRAVTLLQERRTAVISAAVTGKIDVRHWQPPAASA